MTALRTALLALAGAGTLYYALSTLALRIVLRRARGNADELAESSPSVSLLKPVAGLDRGARDNLQTYLDQDYESAEVLFGVLDPADPAVPLIEELVSGRAHCRLLAGSAVDGANNKVRILHNLAAHAKGEILIVTDADTRVSPGFTARIVRSFADERVGAVTCIYRGVDAATLADRLEGLHMTCIFAPGVASAACLGAVDFGLGAAIAVRRTALEAAGGFEAIVDYLADDFQLGRRIARAGWRVVLSDYVIDIALSGQSLRSVLEREVRWTRTTRVSNPRGHFGLILTFGLAYAALLCLTSRFSGFGWTVLGGVTAARAITAALGCRMLGDRDLPRRLPLLPLRDLLSFSVWIAGYFSRCVRWRGRRLVVYSGGRIKPLD